MNVQGFHQLEQTLNAELDASQRPSVTRNVFLQTGSELSETFRSLFSDSTSPVLLISDGVPKQSGDPDGLIDDKIQQTFKQLQIPYVAISLADVLHCAATDVHASVAHVSVLRSFLTNRERAPVLVIGSGSVTDVVKHTVHELGWTDVPFVVLPTALTVTAFTSHFAVLEEAGAKRTRLSRQVDTCLWYSPVLGSAPLEMTRAGYGDLLARFVAYGDWFLGWSLGIAERYDELAFRLMEPFGYTLRRSASAFGHWPVEAQAIGDLSATLAMAGIAMSVSGETTPLSGYEHTVSHALDFLRLTSRRPLSWHGQQVALASLVSAQSYDHLLSMEHLDFPAVRPLKEEQVKRTIKSLLLNAPYFGAGERSLSPDERAEGLRGIQDEIDRACVLFTEDYLKKHARWCAVHESLNTFQSQWGETKARLRQLVIPSSELHRLLELSGLALVPEELSQPTTAQEFRWAVRFAPFVRSRMSLADVIFWLGDDPALWASI